MSGQLDETLEKVKAKSYEKEPLNYESSRGKELGRKERGKIFFVFLSCSTQDVIT